VKKYSVPINYIVWVDVEAEDEAEAIEKASCVPFTVSVTNGLQAEYNDYGTPYEYEDEYANN